MKSLDHRSLQRGCLAAALASLLMGSGCLPVIEGIFDDHDFAIFNDTPESRGQSGDHVLLVFVDMNDTLLRTVSIDLHEVSTLPVDEELHLGAVAGDERVVVEAVEGTLVRESIEGRGDLITVGDDAVRARSTSGGVTLSENSEDGDLAGSFRVDLDDGGFLEGSFTARN